MSRNRTQRNADGTDDVVVAASEVTAAVHDLIRRMQGIPNPAASGALLGELTATQRALSTAYTHLHSWHLRVVDGVHFDGHTIHGNETSQFRAAIYLDTAAVRADAATSALNRALRINRTLRWIDTTAMGPGTTP